MKEKKAIITLVYSPWDLVTSHHIISYHVSYFHSRMISQSQSRNSIILFKERKNNLTLVLIPIPHISMSNHINSILYHPKEVIYLAHMGGRKRNQATGQNEEVERKRKKKSSNQD